MQLSTLLLFAVASLSLTSAVTIPDSIDSNLEKRTCFKTGESYGEQRGKAQELARTACKDVFQGNYRKRETRVKCYDLGNNKSVVFFIGLLGKNAGAARHLGLDECSNGLQKEVTGCGRGGATTYGNWYYRADPNKGGC